MKVFVSFVLLSFLLCFQAENVVAKKVEVEDVIVKPEPLVKAPIAVRASEARENKVFDYKQHYMKPEAVSGSTSSSNIGEGKVVRPRIAVSRFGDTKSLASNPFSAKIGDTTLDRETNTLITKNWDQEAYEGFTEEIVTALMELDRFVVVEREEINKILREQGFQTTGFTEKLPNKDLGVLTGVQYIITGTAGEDPANGEIVVNLRVYDIYRGTVVGAKRIQAKNRWIAIQQAVAHISEKIVPENFLLKVSKAEKSIVYLNAGMLEGVQSGQKFEIYAAKDMIVDPDTNEVLGQDQEKIALVSVSSVKDKFTIATVIEQSQPVKQGDIAKPFRGIYFSGETAKE